jgi:hypothetical protein
MATDTFPTDADPVLELRHYTLHPGRRDDLIALFDREFVETQEAVGLRVRGQFRDLDAPDHFVWLRGFAGLATRAVALGLFYDGPVWARHRDAANATMIDSDDVRLLRPAWPGAGLVAPATARAPAGSHTIPPGRLDVAVFVLDRPADAARLTTCRAVAAMPGPGRVVAWYETESAPNAFPRLPVREGEPVLVALVAHDDLHAARAFGADDPRWRTLAPALVRPPAVMRLQPTARSAWHL